LLFSLLSLYHYNLLISYSILQQSLYSILTNPNHIINMSAEYTPETTTGVAADNDYASRTGQSEIPVQKDEAAIEDPIDADTADSDKVLGMYCLPIYI
jgi:PKD repeat protein